MVHVTFHDTSIPRLLDAAVTLGEPTAAPPLREFLAHFIIDTLTAMAECIPPSHLADALWVFLFIKRDFLLRTAPDEVSRPPALTKDADDVDQKTEKVVEAADDDNVTTLMTRLERLVASRSYSDDNLDCLGAEGATQQLRLDSILHYRHDSAILPSPSNSDEQKAVTTTVQTLTLALEALRHPTKVDVLLQPASMILLVRDLESLWCLKHLCRCMKLRAQRQLDILVGNRVPGAVTGRSTTADRSASGLPLAICFHDYDLLLTREELTTLLNLINSCRPNDGTVPELSIEALLAFGRASRASVRLEKARASTTHPEKVATASPSSSTEAPTGSTRERASVLGYPPLLRNPSPSSQPARQHAIGFIMDAAVSQPGTNPHRQAKNRRLDIIQRGVMNYYYQRMANPQAVGRAGSGGYTMMSAVAMAQRRGDATVIDARQMQQETVRGDTSVLPDHRQVKSLREEASLKESHAEFVKNAFIGLDIQIMAMSGGAVGYYMGWLRGASTEVCLTYATIGLVLMMMVDALLLLMRMGRQDAETMRRQKRMARQRAKLSEGASKPRGGPLPGLIAGAAAATLGAVGDTGGPATNVRAATSALRGILRVSHGASKDAAGGVGEEATEADAAVKKNQ